MTRLALVLAILLGAAPGFSSAREVSYIDFSSIPLGPAMLRVGLACGPDARRLCPHTPPGNGRVIACLASQRDRLSLPCEDEFEKGALLWDAIVGCEADIQYYCDGVPIGGGRIMSCLASNQDRVSDACFDDMAIAAEAYGGYVD